MAKKTEVPKEGIFLNKNSKGFYITIKQNQHKLSVLGGYNNRANAMKGLDALYDMLLNGYIKCGESYGIIDLTKSVKPKTNTPSALRSSGKISK